MKTDFHMKRRAPEIALKKRLKVTRKSPIGDALDFKVAQCGVYKNLAYHDVRLLACVRKWLLVLPFSLKYEHF